MWTPAKPISNRKCDETKLRGVCASETGLYHGHSAPKNAVFFAVHADGGQLFTRTTERQLGTRVFITFHNDFGRNLHVSSDFRFMNCRLTQQIWLSNTEKYIYHGSFFRTSHWTVVNEALWRFRINGGSTDSWSFQHLLQDSEQDAGYFISHCLAQICTGLLCICTYVCLGRIDSFVDGSFVGETFSWLILFVYVYHRWNEFWLR